MTKIFNRRILANVLAILLITALGLWLPLRDRKSKVQRGAAPAAGATEVEKDARSGTAANLSQRIASAPPVEFPGLMLAILDGEPSDAEQDLITRLMQRWIAEDPAGLEAFLDEAEVGGLEIWDRLAPAMMMALRSPGGTVADQRLVAGIVERVLLLAAGSDPGTAAVWAREQLTGGHLDTALAGIAAELAEGDPEGAIRLLDEIASMPQQMQAAADVGLVLGRNGYPLALTWAESFFSETERSFALSGVLAGMASRDSAAAATEYRRIVEAMKEGFRAQVLADRALSGGTVEEEYEGLSPEEIEKAELAKPNPNLVYLENATRAIAAELARGNPREALDWARSMDPYQGRAFALEAIYAEWGSSDPRAAYESFQSEPDRRPEIAARLFSKWAEISPKAAAASALRLDPGYERDTAIEGVAQGWIGSGGTPAGIAAWGEGLRHASERDRVRAVVAAEAAYGDPELAVRQVGKISNPLKRSELFQEVFPNLVEENPQLARSILATIPLSQVELEYFRDMLP